MRLAKATIEQSSIDAEIRQANQQLVGLEVLNLVWNIVNEK